MVDDKGTPQNSNSESSPPPQACGVAHEQAPSQKGPVKPAVKIGETLDGSEYAHLDMAVVATSSPRASGTAQRGLWGMYSSTVLQRRGSGEIHSRRCASPTRGARNLAKILKSDGGSTSSLASMMSVSTSSPSGAAEQDLDGSSSEIHSVPSMLPLEDGDPESVSAIVPEAPEVVRARERAARARENAARAVEKAKAQRVAEAAAKAIAHDAAQVRRRIAGKQKSPPAFPPAPTAAAAATDADADACRTEPTTAVPVETEPEQGQKTAMVADTEPQEQEQEQEQESRSTPPTSPKKRKAQQVVAKGDIPTPPRSKVPRGRAADKTTEVNAT